MTSRDVVLVGEDNPYGADPVFALYHLPRRASGDRLRAHLGLRDATYEGLIKRNLCVGAWSMPQARAAATRLLAMGFDRVVMLGAKVKEAFGVREMEPFTAQGILVALPHPSGRNMQWNQPDARPRARELLRRVAPAIPWGEID